LLTKRAVVPDCCRMKGLLPTWGDAADWITLHDNGLHSHDILERGKLSSYSPFRVKAKLERLQNGETLPLLGEELLPGREDLSYLRRYFTTASVRECTCNLA